MSKRRKKAHADFRVKLETLFRKVTSWRDKG